MKKLVRAAMSVFMASAMMLIPLAAQAAPTISKVSSAATTVSMQKCEQEIKDMLNSTSSKRPAAFYDSVSKRFKYVSARSLCGKNGKWLAFVDIYCRYNGGEPDGYVLQQAYIQYGMQKLPRSTDSVTLKIGNKSERVNYSDQSVFNIRNISLGDDADTDSVNVTVTDGGVSNYIPVTQQFPSKNVTTAKQAVLEMASNYVTYVNSNSVKAFDHTFLRLRSYLKDSKTMDRSYIWELYLVHGKSLPSKATVLRYDCDTRRVTISERDVREYF